MEIIIIFTILTIMLPLGGLHLQSGKLCLHNCLSESTKANIKSRLTEESFHWAVKFVVRELYLLNTVALTYDQKAIQTNAIQSQNIKFEG
ncbi:hypothetical protein [Falsiporphyromonas endometrii]|uniref:Uncharacterized protein n=1 Tax=Falsiporphyromonas endometrii TaxID=1387297 RepID=A0ABV9K508_9PORP